MTRKSEKERRRDASDDVVARRTLKSRDGQQVEVVVHTPSREVSTPDEWACPVKIRAARQPDRVLLTGRGVDSFQALVMALVGLRKALKDEADGLVWLGEPGEIGVPLVVPDHDQMFLSVVDALVQTEYARRALTLKQVRSSLSRRTEK